jgi:hypothetical protein
MTGDEWSGFSAGERAQIEALLDPELQEDDDFTPEAVGLVRRVMRWLLRLICLATLGLVGWHVYALASLPDKPFDAVHAPIVLTIGSALAGTLFILWFDGKWRRALLLLLGVAALALSALSMRWVDSAKSGIHEYWAGLERGRAVLPGDLCYRIDARDFALRREVAKTRFTYQRGIWPSAFSEAEFKRYFFSDLPMTAKAEGWTCPVHFHTDTPTSPG